MKIIHIKSCLRTDDEGRYFEGCPYAVKGYAGLGSGWDCGHEDGWSRTVPKEGIHPDCPLEDE